jgi:hypothetical protein
MHGFATGDRGLDDLARNAATAHQLHHNVHGRQIHHFAPVRGLQCRIESGWKCFPGDAPAAQGSHLQRETKLERDVARVFRENLERPGTDVAETDDADVDRLHEVNLLFDHQLEFHLQDQGIRREAHAG